ncbi:PE-PGRS family protein (plasmid) [Streptomyces sp. BI20]|uniref:PE-PGRS family protein n=1 Tax=Streptomyces sp. BI20 TaxID=3403460 RepID=UPI003C788EB4
MSDAENQPEWALAAGVRTLAGGWRDEEAAPPRTVRRLAVDVPTGTGADPVRSVNLPAALGPGRWWAAIRARELPDADGVFLAEEARPGGPWHARRWSRCRLADAPPPAAVPGAGLLAISLDGRTAVALLPEGDEDGGGDGGDGGDDREGSGDRRRVDGSVRVVVVDDVPVCLDRAARLTAAETPAQRAERWRGFTPPTGPRRLVLGLWEAVCEAVVRRPDVDEDTLRAVLPDACHVLGARELSPRLREAALAHPDPRVRLALADARRDLTPAEWDRLFDAEAEAEADPGPDPAAGRRRGRLVAIAADRRAELTPSRCAALAADPATRVRAEAARLAGLPEAVPEALAADPVPRVREVAALEAWERLGPGTRARLADDPVRSVRAAAEAMARRARPLTPAAYADAGHDPALLVEGRPTRALAAVLVRTGTPPERRALADRSDLDADLVEHLAHDPDPGIRAVIAVHPALPEDSRARLAGEFDAGAMRLPLGWVEERHGDAAEMRRLARSRHPAIRSAVARAPRLPADVVAALAVDEDRVVRLFLAESCEDAPPEMLLEVWRWWTGSLSAPGRPRTHPNFPRAGLLRFAADPEGRMRSLALDDPESTPALVEEFSRDPHPEVRARAAEDPRLSSARAVRLLDDPHEVVRWAAAGHPGLPAGVLLRMLSEPETARAAARHPALPWRVLRPLLTPPPGTARY